MAGVQTRKEDEKKRESHKQTLHKVPLSADLSLEHLSAWKWNVKLMNMKAILPDSVCPSDFYHELVARTHLESTKNVCIFQEQVGSSLVVVFRDALHHRHRMVTLPSGLIGTRAAAICKSSL